ncbi:LAQU0S10e01178g1_1 [Lachancea quebecensis]|uniref:LAQU0S10e01178g1_1 n=1 Tax=Lachancea quebecensis TaxID=1654605 RepID=A0A0P1KTG0_9SACH|nr:LAQU0S10e01178g1_1 [Lachancea quebecensis]
MLQLLFTWIALLSSAWAAGPRARMRLRSDEPAPIRGISLGGWLVTEPFITPSLYTIAVSEVNGSQPIVDEYTLCQYLGYPEAKRLLSNHFRTFVLERDFREISKNGFNLVRIPIGYWAWKKDASSVYEFATHTSRAQNVTIAHDDPYVSDGLQLEYLNKAVKWARKHNLKVLVDLHGAPGSQNGFDNSGQRNLYGKPQFLADETSARIMYSAALSLYEKLRGEWDGTVVGVEIVNEPLASKIGLDKVLSFYYESLELFAQNYTSQQQFVIHDAFEPVGFWDKHFNAGFRNVSSRYTNATQRFYEATSQVLVDHHYYQVFTDVELNQSAAERVSAALSYGQSLASESHAAVVGEWSGAITDCAKYVNGFGIGSRFDGTYYRSTNITSSIISASAPLGRCTSYLDISNWPEDYKTEVQQFIEAQLVAYSNATRGWIFWNWKTESAPEWDFKKLSSAGLFPKPFDNYKYFYSNGSQIDENALQGGCARTGTSWLATALLAAAVVLCAT